jgi:hypothetical protein
MLGVLLYLSTVIPFDVRLLVLLFPVLGWLTLVGRREWRPLANTQKFGLLLMSVATALSTSVFFFLGPTIQNYEKSFLGGLPSLPFLLMAVALANFIQDVDLKAVLALVLFEICLGCSEYFYGVSSFFIEQRGETAFGSTEFFYFSRVYGASNNSSIFALKIFAGCLILLSFFREFKRSVLLAISALLIIGLFITFNRSALGAMVIATVIFSRKRKLLLGTLLISALSLALYFSQTFLNQLSGGHEDFGFTGRGLILGLYQNFFVDNVFFGNAGVKVWLDLYGVLWHPHNSFVAIFSANGFIAGAIFLSGYYCLVKNSWALVLPVAAFSLLQYVLFWGVSFPDIVFLALFLRLSRQSCQIPFARSALDRSSTWSQSASYLS